MATGDSKSKWGGKLPPNANANEISVTLHYEGRRSTAEIFAAPPAIPLVLWQGGPNQLCFGDNLPWLATLLNDKAVCGQVRLIYIDPPFATQSIFKSRAQVDAYSDLLSGAQYLEFMRERLYLLRELLAEDGSLYVHLDDTMAFYIKVLLDEVFGARYFRNWITRKKCNPKNYTRRAYGNVADYIMFYTKSDQYVWNRPVEPWTPERAAKEYIYLEEKTGRRYKKVPLHAPGTRAGATGRPWRGMAPPPGKHWQFPPATLEEMDRRGEIYWSATGNPRRKIYLDESAGIPIQDIWLEFRDAHNQNIHVTGYPTEKNPDLLARIIQASSNPGDLVLDCFAGSGTTLAVASQLDRRWIGIDCSPEAVATTLRRFAKGPEPMGDFVTRPDTEALPLFNLAEPSVSYRAHSTIRDFTLYAALPYQGELDVALMEWQQWIKDLP